MMKNKFDLFDKVAFKQSGELHKLGFSVEDIVLEGYVVEIKSGWDFRLENFSVKYGLQQDNPVGPGQHTPGVATIWKLENELTPTKENDNDDED